VGPPLSPLLVIGVKLSNFIGGITTLSCSASLSRDAFSCQIPLNFLVVVAWGGSGILNIDSSLRIGGAGTSTVFGLTDTVGEISLLLILFRRVESGESILPDSSVWGL